MKATLHIGTEKTGTTTVQRFLSVNRDILRSHGILSPRSLGETNHRKLPAIASSPDYVDDFFRQQGLLDQEKRQAVKRKWHQDFVEELSAFGGGHCIISSEHLQSRVTSDEALVRLRDILAGLFDRVRIVLYIRNPVKTAVSLTSTAVKYGGRFSDVPAPSNPYFRNIVDHEKTIRFWKNGFPDAEFVLRIFDRNEFVNGDLIDDFIFSSALPNIAYNRPEVENESLSMLGLQILSRVNALVPMLGKDGLLNLDRNGMVQFFEKYFTKGPSLTPRRETIEQYEKEFHASNEWVRQNFFPDRRALFAPVVCEQGGQDGLEEEQIDALAEAFASLWKSCCCNDR